MLRSSIPVLLRGAPCALALSPAPGYTVRMMDVEFDIRKPLQELDPDTWNPQAFDEELGPIVKRLAHKPVRRLRARSPLRCAGLFRFFECDLGFFLPPAFLPVPA